MIVEINIEKYPLHSEVASGKTMRYGSFTVSCMRCKEILIDGKRFADGTEEELIWKAIRQHAAEHDARAETT